MGLGQRVTHEVAEKLNAEHQDPAHVAMGLAVCLGAVAAVTLLGSRQGRQPAAPGAEPSRSPLAKLIWPAITSTGTIAALRVWNAPDGPPRSRALALWGATQALGLFWMMRRPERFGLQLAAALSTAAVTALYARSALAVDRKAAQLIAPTSFAGLSSLVAQPTAG
jgi:tryptophan-rich sensory protein